jgi:cyclopropane-fatty-acyl-phospholipid synthase
VRLAEIFMRAFADGAEGDIEFRAYDGSRAGPRDAAVRVVVRTPLAVSYLASAPGELGLSRAYISGYLDIEGDLYTALSRMQNVAFGRLPLRLRAEMATRLAVTRVMWPIKRPALEARLRGNRHSMARDQEAIAHHSDVSNRCGRTARKSWGEKLLTCAHRWNTCHQNTSQTLARRFVCRYALCP